MSNKYWEVSVHDSLELVWQTQIPMHRLSDAGVRRLLQNLAAKFLTFEEITGALINRLKGGSPPNGMLEVSKSTDFERKSVTYSCGSNPFATARTVSGDKHAN